VSGSVVRRRHAPGRIPLRIRVVRRRIGRAVRRGFRALRSLAWRITRLAVRYSLLISASLVAGLLLVALYAEYGYHPIRNAAAWAGQPLRYAVGADCASCHGDQVAALASETHAAVSCQACHGPIVEHVTAAGLRPAVIPANAIPPSEPICLACHERVEGRPATFAVVGATTHFGGAPCLLCHEPHTTVPLSPPGISHSLEDLPDCAVCHGPNGLRPVTERHPVWTDGDCFACHLRRSS
jgi:hypothetical protein